MGNVVCERVTKLWVGAPPGGSQGHDDHDINLAKCNRSSIFTLCVCVSPPHERLVDGGPQVEDVITDGQVVFESEGVQNHTVPNRERQAELLVRITWDVDDKLVYITGHITNIYTGKQGRT